MKLNYKILWFEDDKGSFNAKQRLVKRIVNSLGFIFPEPRNEINGENLDAINFKLYDLIIADLNLSNDKGSNILDKIRSKGIYTEVVFYSSEGEEYVRTELLKFKIDGVYCADRANDDFIEKVEKVIETTIKKVQDVNNTRGLVIAETIELEKKIEYILLKFFEASESQISNETKEKLRNSIFEKKIKNHNDGIAQLEKTKLVEIKELIDQDVLTASNMYDTVLSILKIQIKNLNISISDKGISGDKRAQFNAKKENFEALRTELLKFKIEVIDIRNILAHVEEAIDEDGFPYLKSLLRNTEPIKFNNEKYIEVRKNLQKHSDILDSILANIID